MERKYDDKINPRRFEQHLSPFGNKVLSVLMKQWDKARTLNTKEHENHLYLAQNKRVLTFINESVVGCGAPPAPAPMVLPTTCEQMYLEQTSLNFDLTENGVPEILNTIELLNLPKNYEKDDFVHPTVAATNKIVHHFHNKNLDNDFEDPFAKESHIDPNTSKKKDVQWDDMLDSELLVTLTANKDTNVNKRFDIQFPTENVTKNKNKTNIGDTMTKSVKRKLAKKAETKAKKVKIDNEANRQKVKDSLKPPIKTNNFRKQKYTKAVKNWLNSVEPHHPVDVELGTIVSTSDNEPNMTKDTSYVENIDNIEPSNKHPVTHSEKIVIEKTLKTTKKVVQAQLANKDGVMKFTKPNKTCEGTKKHVNVLETKPKETKEEKVKKFVVPIKSQIPIKDIIYEIRTVDGEHLENERVNLREINNSEIVVVLIYSNGFCQLNSHYTDGTCTPDGIIINHDDMFYCFKGTGPELKEALKRLLENNKVVCYGAQNILIYMATHLQMEMNAIDIYDAKIGASLLDPDNSPENFSDLQKQLSFSAPFTIATECKLQKVAWYMTLLRTCWAKLYGMLVEESLWKVFVEIEMKLLPIIADMERRGICVDLTKLHAMEEILLTRMKLIEQQCYKAAGKTFQINSAVQVRAILYDELQLDTKCNVKIRETISKGEKSTSETMLRSLVSEHSLPKLILEYRHLHKAHATFLTGIAQHVKDGVVRPTWVQTAAATGRIASNNPNLQAIPKAPFSLVMFPEGGDEGSQLLFRSVYVARPGCSLVAADFQHVECRVFAHAAGDEELLRALADDHDLFKVLAAHWLKKSEGEITAEERERTKRLVYASLYGAGARKLMDILNVDYQQALQVAASFNRTFPSLKGFGRDVVRRCAAGGARLASLGGRVRRLPHIRSAQLALRAHAERQAVNFVVQGSAADLCKTAMILTEQQLRGSSPPVSARLLLQIHDELVWEVHDREVDRAAAIIKQVMEGCGQRCGLSGRLPVALSVGRDWGSMRGYAAGAGAATV